MVIDSAAVVSSLARWIVLLAAPLIIGKIFHRLYFHSLRSYPGPLIGKLFGGYAAFWAARETLHLTTYHNIRKYGPVIRQSPNRLIFNTINSIHDIYLNPVANKGRAYLGAQHSKYPASIVCVNRAKHRERRRLLAPAFTDRALREFEPKMKSHIDTFLQILLDAAQKEKVVNVSDRTDCLGVDVIGSLAFGYEFNTQTSAVNREVYKFITFLGYRGNVYIQLPLLHFLESVVTALNLYKTFRFMSIIRGIINARMKEDKDAHNDLYSVMQKSLILEDRENDFQTGELWPESILLLSAGGMTTSTATSSVFFYLSKNPQCYAAAASEIRTTFSSDSEIVMGPKLNSCKYLRACLDEAMRMSPPFLPVSWREQHEDETGPFIVDGRIIPRGTQVGISPYAIMHDENTFPDPFTYTPERWLEQYGEAKDKASDRAKMRKAFVPFLLGDRGCVGKTMAYTEASLTLARTLWYFDFETAPGKKGLVGGGSGKKGEPGSPDEYQLGDIFVTRHDGPNLVFKTRGDLWKGLGESIPV